MKQLVSRALLVVTALICVTRSAALGSETRAVDGGNGAGLNYSKVHTRSCDRCSLSAA
jgi:hypothetical protein